MSPRYTPYLTGLRRSAALACSVLMLSGMSELAFASEDLGNGFIDHGVAVPISNHRGTVATVDGEGRNVVLSWLFDFRGGYSLLMVDTETGEHKQFPIPFDNPINDSPFSSILSSDNKYYTHFGSHFVEFDPVKRDFTFWKETAPRMAMSMTEDDDGVIWSVTYPSSGVVAYNPKTGEFRDFGHVYDQNWNQYQRAAAVDDTGILYFSVGETATQIVALDPATSTATPLLSDDQRAKGHAYVYRDEDGKVYGQASKGKGPWLELYKGEVKPVEGEHTVREKPVITGSQILYHRQFPNGDHLDALDLVERKLTTTKKGTSETKTVSFDYTSEGAIVMGICESPDGTITGGTAFPMRNFVYNPKSDEMSDRTAYGQWNTIASLKDKIFVGGYPSGYLLEWNPSEPWVATDKAKDDTNPQFHMQVTPTIHRPHSLLPLPDESMVIMSGTPGYGYTGGGLLFWDRKETTGTVLEDKDVVPDQSTHAMIDLPGGKILGATTTAPGTGGEKKADQAELYIMDIASKKIEKRPKTIPGVQTFTDLEHGPEGLVYGIADRKIFFVYDVEKAEITKTEDISGKIGLTASEQGPRIFINAGEKLYLIVEKGIAEVNKETHTVSMFAESPVKLKAGGAYMDGRLYFGTDSHILSYKLDSATTGSQTNQ